MPANTVEPRLTYGHQWAQKNLAVSIGDRINKGFFYKEMYGPFCQVVKNNEEAVLSRWFYCIS